MIGRGRERLRGRAQRSARDHSLSCERHRYQRSLRGRQQRRWSSSEQREIYEDRDWHNKYGKEDSYDKEGKWAKVISRGVQIETGPLGPSRVFQQKAVPSGGSNPARLG